MPCRGREGSSGWDVTAGEQGMTGWCRVLSTHTSVVPTMHGSVRVGTVEYELCLCMRSSAWPEAKSAAKPPLSSYSLSGLFIFY